MLENNLENNKEIDFQSKENRERLLDLYNRGKRFGSYFGWELFALSNNYSSLEKLEADLLQASLLNNLPKLNFTVEAANSKPITRQGLFINRDTLDEANLTELGKVYMIKAPNCLILTNYAGYKMLKSL